MVGVQREKEREKDRNYKALWEKRFYGPHLVSRESANGGHTTVEVKCEVHVAMTNGLFLDGMLFYR